MEQQTFINQKLDFAEELVLYTNAHIFLTGKAGSGKTTFLRSLATKTYKRMVVVAPTGVAAINAGGQTIHSFFQLPFGPLVPESGAQSRAQFQKLNKRKLNIIRSLDLSSTTDITAFVLVFPPTDEDDHYYILPYFWLPEETLDLRVRRDHVPYDLWEKQGYLLTTEGNVVHYGFIENFIDELGTRFNIREIAFDRWGAVQMSQNLEGLGFTLVQFGQGYRDMSPPTKELMKLTLEQKIAHNGHPVLRWNMDNIFIKRDPAGNIKPDKEKSTEKIDGTVATIMALDRAIRCGNDTGDSIYDERDLLVL
ncbi:MAG: hypothetical protein K6A28_04140 [Bacteroidales bacterium]|nr:hypothetical protein [Bacteroidales bacterium]